MLNQKIPKKVRQQLNELKQGKIKKRDKYKKKPKPPKNKISSIERKGKRYAHELACKATPAERRFKTKLLAFNFNTCFQKPFTDKKTLYIADFYIPLFALIIELDGGYHNDKDQMEYDRIRDDWFNSRGYNVWRLTNDEADNISPNEILHQLGTYKRVQTK